MKRLIIINGPMGVGKTAVCTELKKRLPDNVFLDGDWCWDMRPFRITAQTRAMALDNICYLINNFLNCPAYQNVLLCWVLHEQALLDELTGRLTLDGCELRVFTLACSKETLVTRLESDVQKGLRTPDVIPRSLERLRGFAAQRTEKINVNDCTAAEAAGRILQRLTE